MKKCFITSLTSWKMQPTFLGRMLRPHMRSFCAKWKGGVLDWSHMERIDRIRRAHAQKHTKKRQNWVKNDSEKKPWYCKLYQLGTCFHARDHEHNGKTYKHICAHYLTQGKQVVHPQKDYTLVKRRDAKNV